MVARRALVACALLAVTHAFAPAVSPHRVCSRSGGSAVMAIPASAKLAVPAALGITGAMALQLRNMQKARASEDAERGRAALASLSTLSDLSGLGTSLDSPEVRCMAK